MSIKLRWLGTACFEIVLPSGKVLITDPYIDYSPTSPIKSDKVTGADYIAITHGHGDHITDVGTLAHKYNSKVICSFEIANPLGDLFDLDNDQLIKVRTGDIIEFDDLYVEVRKAEHVPGRKNTKDLYKKSTGKEPEQGMTIAEMRKMIPHFESNPERDKLRKNLMDKGMIGGEQLSFVFQTVDNLRIHLFGSASYEYLKRGIEQVRPNVLIIQIGGPWELEQVAAFAELSRAELIMLSHHDLQGIEGAHTLARDTAKYLSKKTMAHVADIDIGKWYEIGIKIGEVQDEAINRTAHIKTD